MNFPPDVIKTLSQFQDNEQTEYVLYHRLAKIVKDPHNAEILRKIGDEEKKHAEKLKSFTQREGTVHWFRVWWYYWLARLLGLTFGLKLMEWGESRAQNNYQKFVHLESSLQHIHEEESQHERELLNMLDEERLRYIGSIVLGLNDALVELTGALAGLTFALQDGKLVAVSGLITGIAASFSMSASEYLSNRAEPDPKVSPIKAAIYTGIAYIVTVGILILPYLIFYQGMLIFLALVCSLLFALSIIAVFNFYVSVVKEESFWHRFLEMGILSFGVAILSFSMGYLLRIFFNIDA